MSTYVPLGSRGPVTGVADTTQRNPGKWTITFDPATINCNVPYAEICHIVVEGKPSSTFTVWVDLAQWDTAQNGYNNSWDPVVPISIKPGQYVYFFWSDVDTDNQPPKVTIWLRYDQDILANMQAQLYQPSAGGSS
jgi:hypothetical protein